MKTRKLSIRIKLILYISVVSILCCCIIGIFTYIKGSKMLVNESKEGAMGLAKVAAGEVDGEKFLKITSSDDAYYDELYDTLIKYTDSNSIDYIYTMKMNGDVLEFVVDADLEDPEDVGTEYKFLRDMKPAFEGKVCCDKEISSDEWGKYYSAYAPIFDEDKNVVGIVGCDIGIAKINKDLNKLKVTIMTIGFICCILCIAGAFLISMGITHNMKILHGKVMELNSGTGDLTQKLDITSGDELEQIANEFNTFIEQVQNLLKGVAQATDIIKDSSIHVNLMAENSNVHIGRMNESLETLSAEMEETSASTSLISDNLEDVVKEISMLNYKAEESSSNAMHISNSARETKEGIKVANENAMDVIAKFRGDMSGLEDKSKEIEKIDEIVGEILKVANSTKILAQNTYIEAARAGESGRGFSVIAGNMSKLNEQISELVKRIRQSNNSVKETVANLMDNANNMSDYMSKSIMKDYMRFMKIGEEYSDNMAKMAKMLEQFSGTTKVASDNITMIGESVEEINSVINDATINISEVHSFGINLKKEIDSLVSTAENNAKGSEEMAVKVGKYKY